MNFDSTIRSTYINVLHVVLNSGIANIAVIIRSDRYCDQCSDFLVHDITVRNSKVSSTVLMLKCTDWTLFKTLWVCDIHENIGVHTEANHSSDNREPSFFLASPLCMC